MKRALSATLLSVGLLSRATADVYFSQTFSSGFLNGGAISDGSLNGWNDTQQVNGPAGSWNITNVEVTLTLSGGRNGDLYGYLSHGGAAAVLLNRVGLGQAQGDAFGYANGGMNVTLATGAANGNIHWYGGATMPSGTYAPDGRAIDPLSVPALFDAAVPAANFSLFTGLDPKGGWTLFLADVSAGGGQSTLLSWSLDIEGIAHVPEPGALPLAILALAVAVFGSASCKSPHGSVSVILTNSTGQRCGQLQSGRPHGQQVR